MLLSTLDIISDGRIELGIGAGWHEEEYRQKNDKGLITTKSITANWLKYAREIINSKPEIEE
jgi:alkanesulfonate monooxygenase SsuD/methylene tetrahydromethanopterin reductase-like flavin-dependent oxidoreductase (luciferase family)